MAEKQHAKLSASGAHRWIPCGASIRAERDIPDEGSVYAAEGDAAHDIAEECLRDGRDAIMHLGRVIQVGDMEFEVDREMADSVQRYLNYVRALPGELLIEQRVDFSPWVPGGFGTSDAIVAHDGTAVVADLKYGKGVRVDAEENPQPMLYGLGTLNDFGFLYEIERLKLVIIQPRIDHVSEWEISRDDLLAWAENTLKPAAALALSDDAPFNPGTKQCQFCKARGSCRALAEHNYGLAVEGFEAIDGGPIVVKRTDHLAPAEIAQLLRDIETLAGWADQVKAHATETIRQGGEIPGFKLVEGKSNRKWADEEAAGKALARKLTAKVAFRKKLITITEAEKLLGKQSPIITKHTVKPPGKPTLAPESSEKPALTFDPTEGFDEIPEAA